MMNDAYISSQFQLQQSILEYFSNHNEIIFGERRIILSEVYQQNFENIANHFILTKHKAIEENVLFTAKELYEILSDKPKHIDELILEYSNNISVTVSLNLERIIYLALTFLYSINEVKLEGKTIIKLV